MKNKYINNYINLDYEQSNNIKIYRHFRFKWLINDLINNELSLTKPDNWDDRWENFLLKSEFSLNKQKQINSFDFANRIYSQCWTTNADESDLMWRIFNYSQDKDKTYVRVSTTIGKLFNSLYKQEANYPELSCYIGKVIYNDEKKIEKDLSNDTDLSSLLANNGKALISTLFTKRTLFNYENEIRILYDDVNKKNNDKLYKINMDPNEIFDEIILHPNTPNEECNEIIKIIKKEGYNNLIDQSKIYHFKNLKIDFNNQ